MWELLRPVHFENVILAALNCSFPNADDTEDLEAPSNAIKLKYDIRGILNDKLTFVLKKSNDEMDQEALE
ncbi:hypothetical protein FSP39_020825 [Pinctada imbricata]|uniref:Uncharacterized protein n=1 Tax=Pinctada imbricata TaxID=66713 RepID=A0AA88YL20_PINIB|nr:hypothetical protein FSP39_020825 [Pinctada imbricata]